MRRAVVQEVLETQYMQAATAPVPSDIALIGGGHSHVGVLHSYAMKQNPGARLTMMRSDTETPYSGMLPSDIAGHCVFDEVHVDLCRLAEPAGARHCRDEVVGIARGSRKVLCRNHRPPVAHDASPIKFGSTPRPAGVAGAAGHAVPGKPIRCFNERWLALRSDTQ